MKCAIKILLIAVVWTLFFPAVTQAEDMIRTASGSIQGGGVFNVLTYDAPGSVRLEDTGLREAGLTSGDVIRASDEIRVFANENAQNESPLARIWLNRKAGGAYWFHTGGEGDAGEFVIPQGAMVVVWTRASQETLTWKNVFE